VRRTLGIALIGVVLATASCSSPGLGTVGIPAASTTAGAPTAHPPTASNPPDTEVTSMSPTAFTMSSTAFSDDGAIPKRFTCDGDSVSPDLTWSGAPDATESLALVVTDPDARDFVHWLVYDMTGTPSGGLPVGVSSSPDAPPQGTNSFGKSGYGGPCPPSGEHHYSFVLYALDAPLELSGAPGIDDLQAAMKGHVIDQATLTGTYHR
jgi:Raf kinase inhibitor-like YbhB/YbcL family protein